MNASFPLPGIIERLKNDIASQLSVFTIQLRKPDIITDQQAACYTLYFECDKMIARGAVFQVCPGTKTFIISVSNFPVRIDDI